MLGMLQKRVLGLCHPIYEELFPFHADGHGASTGIHTKQLYGHTLEVEFQRHFYNRSIFGMVHIYNRLPQDIVDSECVASFQRRLTLIARAACEAGDPDWKSSFSCRP